MKFKFSIVMAVYNVELFLEEAIESVISQDIGFDQFQLILVDDGSKDSSGRICDCYAEKYPDNIVVIHKENGGVSSARNEGLHHVQGEYVNFLDADDKLSPQTLREVYAFFEKYGDQTDLACIPLRFFDAQTGEHMLNYKFDHGTRVIDLDVEWANPQLSLSSAFVRWEVFSGLQFDSRLSYAEDAQLVQKILLNKFTLGVVNTGEYRYRKRSSGEASAIQLSEQKANWYMPYLLYFQEGTIQYYLQKIGYVPRFVQFTLMYDLQWRLKQKHIPDVVLSEEEKTAYRQKLFGLLSYIDDEVILAQKHLYQEQKLFVFEKKYNCKPRICVQDNDGALCFGSTVVTRCSNTVCRMDFFRLGEKRCIFEGRVYLFPGVMDDAKLCVSFNHCDYLFDLSYLPQEEIMLDEVVLRYTSFKVEIPLTGNIEQEPAIFSLLLDGAKVTLTNFRFGSFFPVSNFYSSAYYAKNGWKLSVDKNIFFLEKVDKRLLKKCERTFLQEVWQRNEQGGRKAVIARCALRVLRHFKRRPLWLVSDRVTKAGDNGEAFFRYMRAQHPEIDARFVLSKSSPNYAQMEKVGPVLDRNSFKHKLLSLMSDYIISSQAEVEVYNPFHGHSAAYQDILADTKFIFLQHGITKDDISDWLNRFNKNLYGFVTAAGPEYQSILNGKYFYTDKQVWFTGFPRFDRLYSNEQKQITIMPTWRRYLMGSWDSKTDMWSLAPGVANSEYLKFYNALLNNERLLHAAEKYGYHICFLPHPNFQTHLDLFKQNDAVRFLGNEVSYRDIYAVSELVITDYSSAVFDFAYLRKPVIYTHFDAETFFAGAHVYSKGYFDYERDGFGEVEYDLEGTVDRIIEYMSSGCKLKDKYRERIDNFFAFNDKNNCQRVYERILELEKETR